MPGRSGLKLSGKSTKDEEGEEALQFVRSQQEPPPNESTDRRIGPEIDEDLLVDDDEKAIEEEEAPEIMTAAAGLNQSRSLASKAARVLERQKVAANQKRKEHDILLKSQAQSRKRKKMEIDLPDGPTGETAPTSEKINDRRGLHDPVPALLPESILLVEEEPAGPLLKSNQTPKKSESASHRLRILITVPPKDLKQGAKTVRVLESNRVLLPPRSELCGKGLRESWLFGRRSGGRNRNGAVPRRKMGSGFLRSGGL